MVAVKTTLKPSYKKETFILFKKKEEINFCFSIYLHNSENMNRNFQQDIPTYV